MFDVNRIVRIDLLDTSGRKGLFGWDRLEMMNSVNEFPDGLC